MALLEGTAGTLLSKVGLLDPTDVRRLTRRSITTVEDLLGMLQADPRPMARFLPDYDMAWLEAAARRLVGPRFAGAQRRLEGVRFATGACVPEGAHPEDPGSEAALDRIEAEVLALPRPRAPRAVLVDLSRGFRPIRDQGQRATCVAHACCALLEYVHRRSRDLPDDVEHYSPQFVYWAAKQRDHHPQKQGTLVSAAMQAMANDGACWEPRWPYDPRVLTGNESHAPAPAAAVACAPHHRAARVCALTPWSWQAVRAELDKGLPVVVNMSLWDHWYSVEHPDLRSANVNGKIMLPIEGYPRYEDGNHAICVVGYAFDEEQFASGWYFIFRNSWGTLWAEQSIAGRPGYGALPFEYISLHCCEAYTAAAREN